MSEFLPYLSFPRFLILSGMISLGFYFGEGFIIPLVVNYLFCRIVRETKNKSLMISSSLGTIFASTMIAFSWIFPILKNNFFNLIYIFLATNFLMHYFFWCVLEFDLLDNYHTLFIGCLHSSLPSLCCFIFTMLFCGYTGFRFSFFISLFGFLTLQLSLATSQCLREKACAQKTCNVIWKCLFDMCTTLLLDVFPILTYLIELFWTGISGEFFEHTTNLVFLLCCTRILAYISKIPPKLWNYRIFISPTHRILTAATLASGTMVSLRFASVPHFMIIKPYELCLTLCQLILFVGMLVMCHFRQRYRALKAPLLLLLVVLCGFFLLVSAKVPQVAHITLWNGSIPSSFSFTILLCTLSAVLPVIMQGQFSPRILKLSFALFLLGFHTVEWQLFQSMILSEKWFLMSSVLTLLVSSLYVIRNPTSVESANMIQLVFTPEFVGAFAFAPTATKLALVGLNRLFAQMPMMSSSTTSRGLLQFDRGFVIGSYFIAVGLTCSCQIFLFLAEPMRQAKRMRNEGKVFSMIYSFMNTFGLVIYFRAALGMCWPALSSMVFGYSGFRRVILFPAAIGLSGLSLYTSAFFSSTDVRHILGPFFVGSIPCNMIVLSGFVFTALMLLGKLYTVTINLFLLLLALPVVLGALVHIAFVAVGISTFHTHRLASHVLPAVRFGLIGGCLLLAFLTMIDPHFASCGLLLGASVYSSCLFLLLNEDSGAEQTKAEHESESIGPTIDQSVMYQKVQSARAVLRLKLLVACFGVIGFTSPTLAELLSPDLSTWSKESLLQLLSLSTFALGQLVSDRVRRFILPGVQSRRGCDSSLTKTGRWISDKKYGAVENTLVTWFVNLTVVVPAASLLLGCSWNWTEFRVLFIPWLFFGLTGRSARRNPKLAPLLGFTVFLLISLYFHLYSSRADRNPPLPTFTRQWFRVSHSYWLWWAESSLTTLLIPIHFVFLAHQANVYTYKGDLSYATPYFLAFSHASSQFCALILLSTYILTPCCLAYLILATSPVSALYGLYTFVVCCYSLLWIDIRTGPDWLIH